MFEKIKSKFCLSVCVCVVCSPGPSIQRVPKACAECLCVCGLYGQSIERVWSIECMWSVERVCVCDLLCVVFEGEQG
jgi:hypothetical protein